MYLFCYLFDEQTRAYIVRSAMYLNHAIITIIVIINYFCYCMRAVVDSAWLASFL